MNENRRVGRENPSKRGAVHLPSSECDDAPATELKSVICMQQADSASSHPELFIANN